MWENVLWPEHKKCIAFVSTQGVHCFNTSAYTSNLHWIALDSNMCNAYVWLPLSTREAVAGSHLHLYGKRRLEPCTSPRNKFWSFYYTGTIRPTSSAGHVKKIISGLIAWRVIVSAVCGGAFFCSAFNLQRGGGIPSKSAFAIIFDHLVLVIIIGIILVITQLIAMVYKHVRLSLLQGRSG